MGFDPARGGHEPLGLLAALMDWVEGQFPASGGRDLERLLLDLRNCSDRVPAALCIRLGLSVGTTHGTVSRYLRAEADRDSDGIRVEPDNAYKRFVRGTLIGRVEARVRLHS